MASPVYPGHTVLLPDSNQNSLERIPYIDDGQTNTHGRVPRKSSPPPPTDRGEKAGSAEGSPANKLRGTIEKPLLCDRRGVDRPTRLRTQLHSEIEEEEEDVDAESEELSPIKGRESPVGIKPSEELEESDYRPSYTPDPSRHSSPKRKPSTVCCRCLVLRSCSSCCDCGIFYTDTELQEPPKGSEVGNAKPIHIFEWYDLVLGVLGICLYLADVTTDLWMAGTFLHSGQMEYGGLTLTLVLLAYLVNGIMSLSRLCHYGKSSRVVMIPILVAVLLNLGPVLIISLYLYCGVTSRRNGNTRKARKDYVEKMMKRNAVSCWLRLFEGCLESAPQLVFQLFILLTAKPQLDSVNEVFRALALLSSWFSLALALAAFRNELFGESQRTSFQHMALDFLWRLAETGGRVLSIALFASLFRWWSLAVLIPHALIMSVCFYHKNRDLHNANVMLGLLVGYFSLFSFIQIFYHKGGDEEDADENDGGFPADRLSTDDRISDDEQLGNDRLPTNDQLSTSDRLPTSDRLSTNDQLSIEDRLSCSDYYSTIGKFSVLSQNLETLKGSLKCRDKGPAGGEDADSDSVNDYFYEHYFRVRYRSCLLYGLFYVENFTMLILWYVLTPERGVWYHHWGLVAGLLSLPLHALFQRLYRCPELGRKRSPTPSENLYFNTGNAGFPRKKLIA